jgi:hypothetical protein
MQSKRSAVLPNRRSDSLILAGVEPGLDPLRDDPRFAAVLKRVGWRRH